MACRGVGIMGVKSMVLAALLLWSPPLAMGQSSLGLPPALEQAVARVELSWEILDGEEGRVWPQWDGYRSLGYLAGLGPAQEILINPPGTPDGGFVLITPPEADVPIYTRRPSQEPRMWPGSFGYTVRGTRRRGVRFPAPTEEYAEASYEESVERFLGEDPEGRFRPLFHHEGFITSVIIHEAFHRWQMEENARKMGGVNYDSPLSPHEDRDRLLRDEGEILTQLFRASNRTEAQPLAREFLRIRQERRASLTQEDIRFERRNEYVEGLATYVETKALLKSLDETDPSLASLAVDFRVAQIRAVARENRSEGEAHVRCYFFGMALAFGLDLLWGDRWKEEVMREGVYLDQLLEKAVARR